MALRLRGRLHRADGRREGLLLPPKHDGAPHPAGRSAGLHLCSKRDLAHLPEPSALRRLAVYPLDLVAPREMRRGVTVNLRRGDAPRSVARRPPPASRLDGQAPLIAPVA